MPWDKPYCPPMNQRLAPELYTRANHVYFMTIRAYNNQSPFAVHGLNTLVLDVLREEQERQNCAVFTYSLMPDHLHFLISPKMEVVSVLKFTDRYKGKTTNRIISSARKKICTQLPNIFSTTLFARGWLHALRIGRGADI
ncbi:MAG: transposase [Syntrophobacteraceae bacterium]